MLPNSTVPNSMNMEFNWLTLQWQGRSGINAAHRSPGDRVRIRFVNLGMDHHPIHLHGLHLLGNGTEGGTACRRRSGGPATLCWSASPRRAISSLSRTAPATGCFTAIFLTT